ncbi:cytochrome P450 [Nocardia sp. GAS34]|uniref:cytochrome P450 n=1 Tax=unclassified Nocardia TaxID=2637762 RepID=UPI003D1BC23A
MPIPPPPTCPAGRGSPSGADGPPVPLYVPEFAADPHRYYREMRARFGSLAPVELAPGVPATLVIGYRAALRILNDPDHFPADPRTWEQNIPAECPILPIMQWRPISSRSAGSDFARYRSAVTASIDAMDLHSVHGTVERIALSLIDRFSADGTADLLRQYAAPLGSEVAAALLGCPPEIGQRIGAALAAMFDGIGAEEGNRLFGEAVVELVQLKQAEPGNDVTTRLLRHPSGLGLEEVVNHAASFCATIFELQQNLIANTLLPILSNDGLGDVVAGGNMSTRDALDAVLFDDPPLANMLATYPRQPILIDNFWLPAHQPVLISMAACNNDPAIRTDDLVGNRSHLAWGAGPHACPGRSMAYLIAQDAIDQLLDMLPDMRLTFPAGRPVWRPGPFHRALESLPVEFTPAPPVAATSSLREGPQPPAR